MAVLPFEQSRKPRITIGTPFFEHLLCAKHWARIFTGISIFFIQQLTRGAMAIFISIWKIKKWKLGDSKLLAQDQSKPSDSWGSCPRLLDFLVWQKGRHMISALLKIQRLYLKTMWLLEVFWFIVSLFMQGERSKQQLNSQGSSKLLSPNYCPFRLLGDFYFLE